MFFYDFSWIGMKRSTTATRMACDWQHFIRKKKPTKCLDRSKNQVHTNCFFFIEIVWIDESILDFYVGIKFYFWTAGTCQGNEPYFYWMGHEKPMIYTNWYTTAPDVQPNNGSGTEDCIELATHLDYKWSDVSCAHKLFTICEEKLSKTNKTFYILLPFIYCLMAIWSSNFFEISGILPGEQSLHDTLNLRIASDWNKIGIV